MITQIQMAEEWGRQDQAWKSKYLTESFRSIKEKEIRNAQHSMAGKEYEGWFNESRARFRDLEQKALTSRNWTLSLYEEVRNHSVHQKHLPSSFMLVWVNRAIG